MAVNQDQFQALRSMIREEVEQAISTALRKQTLMLERRLMDESLKHARDHRKQAAELRESLGRVIRETFETVYHDHPTTQELENYIEDIRDEVDQRFIEHSKQHPAK